MPWGCQLYPDAPYMANSSIKLATLKFDRYEFSYFSFLLLNSMVLLKFLGVEFEDVVGEKNV